MGIDESWEPVHLAQVFRDRNAGKHPTQRVLEFCLKQGTLRLSFVTVLTDKSHGCAATLSADSRFFDPESPNRFRPRQGL